jgi:hypothetical protein
MRYCYGVGAFHDLLSKGGYRVEFVSVSMRYVHSSVLRYIPDALEANFAGYSSRMSWFERIDQTGLSQRGMRSRKSWRAAPSSKDQPRSWMWEVEETRAVTM